MSNTSFLYDQSSLLISVVLFGCLVLSIEGGFRFGIAGKSRITKKIQSQINAILASMLGILALLMGFIFAQSLERYDARSEAVIDEANAIGTAFLRTDLTPASIRDMAKNVLRDYVDLRVQAAEVTLHSSDEAALIVEAQKKQTELWRLATEAAAASRDPVAASFIASVNEMIDSYGKRYAEVTRHVPESVILMLMFTIALTGVVVGFSSGAEDHRPSVAVYALATLIVLLFFLVIDLDRPRRGLIEVSHDNLKSLQTSVQPGGSYNIDQ